MALPQRYYAKQKEHTKDHILYDSVGMKYPEKVHLVVT
jgi:hypothetical protein